MSSQQTMRRLTPPIYSDNQSNNGTKPRHAPSGTPPPPLTHAFTHLNLPQLDGELEESSARRTSLHNALATTRTALDTAQAALRVCRQSAFESVLRGDVALPARPTVQPRFSLLPAPRPVMRRLEDLEARPPGYTVDAPPAVEEGEGEEGQRPPQYAVRAEGPPGYSPVVNVTLVMDENPMEWRSEEALVQVQVQNSGGELRGL